MKFNARIVVPCTDELPAVIKAAAAARYQKPSEWTRQSLIGVLRAQGFEIADKVADGPDVMSVRTFHD